MPILSILSSMMSFRSLCPLGRSLLQPLPHVIHTNFYYLSPGISWVIIQNLCLHLTTNFSRVLTRSYSAFFPQCLLHIKKVFNTYLLNEQWKTPCILQGSTTVTFPVILSPMNYNRSDWPIFWALYIHSHTIFFSRFWVSKEQGQSFSLFVSTSKPCR